VARKFDQGLLIRLAGDFPYESMVEASFQVGLHWDPSSQQLLMDFTDVGTSDQEGMRFLLSHVADGVEHGGRVFLVKPPAVVRSMLAETLRGQQLRTFRTREEALTSLKLTAIMGPDVGGHGESHEDENRRAIP
jgi:hypothetical protein